MAIQILNPAPGGREFTTLKRALAYVNSKQAVFIGRNGMRFLSTPEQQRMTAREFDLFRSQGFYDKAVGSGCLNQRQAKHIPFAGNVARMGLGA